MNKPTIAAIGTPPGRGGIGIIRITGPDSSHLISQITKTASDLKSLTQLTRRSLVYGFLIDQEGNKLDEILIAIFPATRSFTGEVAFELHCHGGRAVLELALKRVIAAGAEPAGPGDFTRRAVENGRMDLIKAEAIYDLIHARTEKGVKSAWRQLEGGFSRICEEIREQMLTVHAHMSAAIDFDQPMDIIQWNKCLAQIQENLTTLIKNATLHQHNKQEAWVVFSGPPNTGKSSIFNEIVNMERALVSDEPGTTRDHISEIIDINGNVVRLTDTAGIHETSNRLEKIAIDKSRKQIEAADIIVYVLDYSKEISHDQLKKVIEVSQDGGLVLFNKSDLTPNQKIREFLNTNRKDNILEISALTKKGWENMMTRLSAMVDKVTPSQESQYHLNIRQEHELRKTENKIHEARKIIEENGQLDVAQYCLQQALGNIETLVGKITTEDVMSKIFSKFCIGK